MIYVASFFQEDAGNIHVCAEQQMGDGDETSAAENESDFEEENSVAEDDNETSEGEEDGNGGDSDEIDDEFNEDLGVEFEGEAGQHDSILNMKDPERPLYPGSNVSRAQAFLAVMSFIIRHSLTNTCVEDLLELIDLICPNTLPKTRYLLYKNIKLGSEHCKAHLFCEHCLTYICVYSGIREHKQCPGCDAQMDTDQIFKKGCFFLYISIEHQLKVLLPKFEGQLVKKSVQLQNPNLVSPLNGRAMREYMEGGLITDDDITLLWNCDGAPVFKSSSRSIWPIQLTVNEIQQAPHANKILAGLWFHREKPPNHTLFKPFVEEMTRLGTHGFEWGRIQVRKSRAFVLCCTSDACARPFMRNANQFNGAYGCDFCCQEGERIERGNGFSRIYRMEPNAPLRTAESFRADAIRGSDGEPSHGIKGVGELMFLPNFNMVRGFVPDYLHCICYGVMRMLFDLWFNSSNHREHFYIGTRIPEIDRRLRQLKPPSEIHRVSITISDRRRWKANEFRSFLLFYSLLLLEGILAARYYAHLYLLVFATHCLTQDSVSLDSIAAAERALYQFVEDVPRLYSEEYCTFNVHQLLHVPNAVRDWGPFHLTSTFRFESNIGDLVSLVRGTKCVPAQICRTFLLKSYLPQLIDEHFPADDRWKSLMKRLNCSGHYNRKTRNLVSEVNLYGAPTFRNLKNTELFALFTSYGINEKHETRIYRFYRAFAPGSLYLTTLDYNKGLRHTDFVALDNTGVKQIIVSCCVGKFECGCEHGCECLDDVVLFVKPMTIGQSPLYTRRRFDRGETFHQLATASDVLYCKAPREMVRKCFQAKTRNNRFCVVPLPNQDDVY